MSESLIRAQIYSILGGVTNIGKVYDYERWADDWEAFINLFKTMISSKAQIRGWEIRRRAAPSVYDSNAEEVITHQYILKGYLAVEDASSTEKTFNNLIEAIRTAFRFNFTLSGLCEMAGPISAEIIEERMFGSVLCHYCELSLPVKELNT